MKIESLEKLGRFYLTAKGDTLTPDQMSEIKQWIAAQYDAIPVRVEFVDYNPYKNRDQMAWDIERKGVLRINRGGSESAIGSASNLMLRAVHDYFGHYVGGYGFDPLGEWETYRTHSRTATSNLIKRFLFSEIVLQVGAYLASGNQFPDEQKIILV